VEFGPAELQALSPLTKLRVLILGEIYGSFKSFSGMTNLTSLTLEHTMVGSIKDWQSFTYLTNLEELDITYWALKDCPVLHAVSSLTKLKRLVMDNYIISESRAYGCLSRLTSLRELGLPFFASCSDSDFMFLNSLVNLERLYGKRLQITDTPMQSVAHLLQLTHLSMIAISGVNVLNYLSALTKLRQLNIESVGGNLACHVTSLEPLSHLINLEYLNIDKWQTVNYIGLSSISSCSKLRHLNMKLCRSYAYQKELALQQLTFLTEMPKLKSLVINQTMADDFLITLSSLPNLKICVDIV